MDAVSEVKARLAIEDVIGEYVQLKRSGRNFKGLSPFTAEKSPSFMVSPEKQIWHDFSSGRGGNIFSFIMEVEGLDFKGALELLARKAGVDLEVFNKGSSGLSKQKQRLKEALAAAAKFYQIQLTKSELALGYVRNKRQFTKQTILDFQLGYSPNTGSALVDYLGKKGFTKDELKKAGLGTERSRGFSDMFRGRLMIPLCDQQGEVVGFTARILEDDPNAPKYINTPSTFLYDKSRHVYGLHLAKEGIRKSGFVVVAEGNLDVISSHQAGVTQVVATAGTAMTSQQFGILKRFTGDVRLCFDADKAGQNATERAIPLAQQAGVTLSVISLASGKDPDELIKQDISLWQESITKHQYAIDWLIERYKEMVDISTAVGKKRFADIVLALVKKLDDEVERDHYVRQLAGILEVSVSSMQSKMAHEAAPRRLKQAKTTSKPTDTKQQELTKMTQHFMGVLLYYPNLRGLLATLPDGILEGESRALADFLAAHPDFDGDPKAATRLKDIADYVKMLGLLTEETYQHMSMEDLQYQITALRNRLVSTYIKIKKHDLAIKLQQASEDELPALMKQAKELDHLQADISL